MAHLLQHGQHPDADQLNAFMEKASPEHERLAMLAHLAGCEECRDIVFLAQKDLLPEAPLAADQDSRPWWKAWWRPVLLTGIAVACLFLVVSVGVQRFMKKQNTPAYVAKNEAKTEPSPEAQSQLTPSPVEPQTIEPPQAKRMVPAPEGRRRRAIPERSGSQGVSVTTGTAGGILGGIGTAPEIAAGSPPAAGPAPAPQGGPARINGSHVSRLLTTEGPLHLMIEHGQGADNGLSDLRGTVRDPAGAVIPRATIALRGLSGQANVSATSDAGGGFTLASLPPGQYEIQVASPGFQLLTQRINLQANDLAQIDPVLPLGSAAQTVAVTASAPEIQTDSAEVASTIGKSPERTFVSEAALNGTLVAFDTSGALFRKGSAGGNWKKIRPKWHGAVVKLSIEPQIGFGEPSFLITTNSGESWTSPDGHHWKRR